MSAELRASSVDEAWFSAVRHTLSEGGATFHLLVRIRGTDSAHIHDGLDSLLASEGKQSIETVANTIFPAQMAATATDPTELAARYRRIYPKIRSIRRNSRGTYFGRMVEYPVDDGSIDQLGLTITKLGAALNGQGFTSCYEMSIISPADDIKMRMQFPCLSYISFHLEDKAQLHMFASYRNHYIVERAYGNYLGLRRLQFYIASHLGIDVGELAVFSGHAEVDGRRRPLRKLLSEMEP